MALTFSRVALPNEPKAIQVDGLPDSPIYLRVSKGIAMEVPNLSEGVIDRALSAIAQELDANGDEIAGAKGPEFVDTLAGQSIIDRKVTIQDQLRWIRKQAIKMYLASRRLKQERTSIPNNLSDISGEI